MYFDGEMPAETFKERMELIASRYGPDLQLYGYNRDALGRRRDAAAEHARRRGVAYEGNRRGQARAIVFDSIMCLLVGVMSEEESWAPVKRLVRKSRAAASPRCGCTILGTTRQEVRHENARMGDGYRRGAQQGIGGRWRHRHGVQKGAAEDAGEPRAVRAAVLSP